MFAKLLVESKFIVDHMSKNRMETFASPLVQQISLLLLWLIIYRKKVLCVLFCKIYTTQAAGNFNDRRAWKQKKSVFLVESVSAS